MIKKYIIIGGLLSSLTLLGGTANANEQLMNSFESRVSELNHEILRIEGGARAQGMGCEVRLTTVINEFPTLFLQNYVCDADTKGRAQIMLRQS